MVSTQLMNVGLTQTVYLQAVGTTAKFWFAGNGYVAFDVKSAVLTMGSVSVAVTVGGHTSFQVPALGRWSDFVSTAGFTLPGNATLSTMVFGEVPIIYRGSTGGVAGWAPAVATGVEYNATTSGLLANFYSTYSPSSSSAVVTMNASASGYYGSLIIDMVLADLSIFALNYSRVGNTIASSLTVEIEEQLPPYEDEEMEWFNIKYYASAVSTGTVTVCMEFTDVHVTPYDNHYATPSEIASMVATGLPNPAAPDCAVAVENKCYVTLTETQAINMKALLLTNADPTVATWLTWLLLIFEIMQVVFDDHSVIDGEYTEPTLTETTEILSTETITVTSNPTSGETLTINIGSIPIVYTFVNLPTGAKNEILIGGTTTITAANIASALNATDGAIFTATSSTNIASITDYTSETVTKTTTSAGITIGDVIQTVIYTTPAPVATLPAFTGNGFCDDGTAFLPAFTAAGTCTQDDFCIGNAILPTFRGVGQSFIMGMNSTSTNAEKISLLLYGNGWMQNFAGMVGIASEPDASALLAVQFVANYITYAPDLTTWSVADYWIDPRATLYYATGDCEDGAFLLASILLNLGVSHTKVRVAIGTYNGVGHAWVLYQRDSDGLWVLLDWTAGATYWNAISDIDDLSIAYSTSGYNPTEYVTAYYVSDVASVTSSVFMYDNALTAWLQVVTEALEFADSVTRGLGIGIHDWLTLKDTQANNWNGKETVPDALMLYDLATGYQRYSVSVVDSLDIADAATRALLIAVLEKLHFTDLAGMIATISKTATDSLDLTDFAGNTYLDTITEALSLVDVASILKTTYGVVSEALAFADTLSGYRNLPLSATSTLTLSETVSAKGTFYRAVYDTIIMNVMVELAGEVYECYVLNTPKFLPSMYSGFNFNSYCVFENRAFAANGTGIYELTGDTDAGTAIHSGVLMHNSDFGAPHQKRFRRGYLGISGGSPVMVLETEDGGRLAYTIDNNGKAVFSHEQKSKKWTLSVSDFDELDSIKLIPVILSR